MLFSYATLICKSPGPLHISGFASIGCFLPSNKNFRENYSLGISRGAILNLGVTKFVDVGFSFDVVGMLGDKIPVRFYDTYTGEYLFTVEVPTSFGMNSLGITPKFRFDFMEKQPVIPFIGAGVDYFITIQKVDSTSGYKNGYYFDYQGYEGKEKSPGFHGILGVDFPIALGKTVDFLISGQVEFRSVSVETFYGWKYEKDEKGGTKISLSVGFGI